MVVWSVFFPKNTAQKRTKNKKNHVIILVQLGARDFHAQSRHGLRIIVMIYSAFCFRMSGFARILLGMGGGTVHSSFECVASGPSGCRCERSSWCAAIRQSVQNQLTWNTFKNIVLLYFRSKTVQ